MRPGDTTHQAFYRKGCLLLACSQTEGQDSIWLIEPDSFPFQYNLMESFATYPLNGMILCCCYIYCCCYLLLFSILGRTWAMAESIESGELEAVDSLSPLPPSLVTQHAFPPRKFILLSTEV